MNEVWIVTECGCGSTQVIGVSLTEDGAKALADQHHALFWKENHGEDSYQPDTGWEQDELHPTAQRRALRWYDSPGEVWEWVELFPVRLDTVVSIYGWPALVLPEDPHR